MSKTIVITGTSSGFGNLSVKTLAADGHKIFATMRGVNGKNAEAARELTNWAKENGSVIEVVELDVTSDASVQQAADHILSQGPVDVVVNNAGIYGGGIDEAYSVEDYKKIFEVNVFGVLRVNRAFLPAMRKREEGLFITISSLMGRMVIPYASAYTASKWAVEAIAESMRYELAPLGIDSTIVEPGGFPTELFSKVYQPEHAEVMEDYGDSKAYFDGFMQSFQNMMSGDVPNKPQHVADAVKSLVDTPAGERPLRIPVDQMMGDTAEPINRVAADVQEEFLSNMQMGDLLQTKSSSPAQ